MPEDWIRNGGNGHAVNEQREDVPIRTERKAKENSNNNGRRQRDPLQGFTGRNCNRLLPKLDEGPARVSCRRHYNAKEQPEDGGGSDREGEENGSLRFQSIPINSFKSEAAEPQAFHIEGDRLDGGDQKNDENPDT